MAVNTVSRVALAVTGRNLKLHESILVLSNFPDYKLRDAIAETFEAVLGAVYVDSNYSVKTVKNLIRRLRVADHQYLKTREELLEAEGSLMGSPSIEERTSFRKSGARDAAQMADPKVTLPTIQPAKVTRTGHVAGGSDTMTQPIVQPRHDTSEAELAEPHVKWGRYATTGGELEPQPEVSSQEINLPQLPPTAKPSTPVQLSFRARKEVMILKKKANKTCSRRYVEKEAALRALHEHATILRKGVQMRPLVLSGRIIQELEEEKAKKLATAREATEDAELTPIVAEKPAPPAKVEKGIEVLERMAKKPAFVGPVKDTKRRTKREAAQRALHEHAALLKRGTHMSPFEVYQKIKEQMLHEHSERMAAAESKERLQERAQNSAEAPAQQEPVTSRQAGSTSSTSDISPLRSTSDVSSEAQDQDPTDLTIPAITSTASSTQAGHREKTEVAKLRSTAKAQAHGKSLRQIEADLRSHQNAWATTDSSLEDGPLLVDGRDPRRVRPANETPRPADLVQSADVKGTKTTEAHKQTPAELQDELEFFESELDLKGFMTFEDRPSGAARPSKDLNSLSQVSAPAPVEPMSNAERRESEARKAPLLESPVDSTTNSAMMLTTELIKRGEADANRSSHKLTNWITAVYVIDILIRKRKLKHREQKLSLDPSPTLSSGDRPEEASPYAVNQESQVQEVLEDPPDSAHHREQAQRHGEQTNSETLPAETLPAETLPAETLPAETQPAETPPAATPLVETPPAETQPAETLPAETLPAETLPAETQPAETPPVATPLVETPPAETQPAETQPAETQPAETQPAETQPAETQAERVAEMPSQAFDLETSSEAVPVAHPAESDSENTVTLTLTSLSEVPAQIISATHDQPGPNQSSPDQAESTQSEPAQSEPTRSEPTQSEPTQSKPTQSEPTQSEPTQSEPTQSESNQSEPNQFEPNQSEPNHLNPS
jgi:hypothetical protein